MNTFFFHRDEFNHFYNCSQYSVESVPLEKRRRIVFGCVYIFLFFLLEALYAPIFMVFVSSRRFTSASYRIMLLLVVVDSTEIMIVGLFTGIFAITGTVYCSNQILTHIIGIFGTGFWFTEGYIAFLLAFNRCVVMYDKGLAERLFEINRRVYYWMTAAVGMGMTQIWFVNPTLYNPISGFYLFNPHYGYINYIEYFDGKIDIVVQACLCIAFISIYGVLGILLWLQRRGQSHDARRISRKERNIFIQVFIISALVVIVGIGLIYMQLSEEKEVYSLVVSLLMPIYLGCPALIYLTANKSIRSEIRAKWYKCKRISSAITPWMTNTNTYGHNSSTTQDQ